MTKARNLSDLLDGNGDVKSTNLDNVPASDNASALTTGTLPIARLADSSITPAKLSNDAKVVKSGSAPSNPVEGNLWYDTTNDILKVYDDTSSSFVKVVRITPILTSISGSIINGTAKNLTLNGSGFLATGLIVSFTPSGGSASTVTVTPTSDTSATVAVPSAIYNQSTSTVIGIKVTNSDTKSSGTVNKTVVSSPSGGTISTSGNYTIHTFNSSGTFVNTIADLSVEYLVIAGGGGGGGRHAGGGGAGGYRSSVSGENSGGGSGAENALTLNTGNYTVTVGAGGVGGAGNTGNQSVGQKGGDSVFGSITSLAGGGGHNDSDTTAYVDGGSGGGGTYETSGHGSGTAGQGTDGGQGTNAQPSTGSGGGGASQAGQSQTSSKGGDGGDGVSSSITGSAVTRAGGGGGGKDGNNSGTAGSGGAGGGTNGGGGSALTDASANTGGGGGGYGAGMNGDGTRGANGGSGVVIVRYQL